MKPQGASLGNPDTIDMLRKRVDARGIRMERVGIEEVWLKNMAYFSGQHHFYIEGGHIWDATPDIPEHKVIYRVNLTNTACLRAAAKILNVHPQFRAVPQTSSIKHRNVAEVSERVFHHVLERNDWDYLVSLIGTMWAEITGSGFYKVWFDPLIGEIDRFYIDQPNSKNVIPAAMLDPQTMHEKDAQGLFEDRPRGDIRIENETTFAVFHDWTSRDKSVAGCQWIATRHFMDKEIVAERFGIDEADLQTEETTSGLIQYEEAIAFMSSNMNIAPFSWAIPNDKRGKRCMLVEMWERPSQAYPKGRRVVQAGGRILKDGDNPYVGDYTSIAHLPFVKQDWTPHPGRFWGRSLVEDLTSPQHFLNDARGCLLEFLRIFGRPATFVGSMSGIDPEKITIEPGGVYVVQEVSKGVTHAPVPQLPADVVRVGELCQSDLLSIASQSEVDGNKLPGQIRTGAGIQMMQEQRDIALSVPMSQAIRAARDVGRIVLAEAKLFYDQKRTLRYLGDDNEFEFMDYYGADLSNDLIVVGEPSVLDTANARKQEVLDAVQAGALNPMQNAEDRELMLAALNWNDPKMVWNSKLKARKNQETEIREIISDPTKFVKGGYPVMDWEDHETEFRVCVEFMYSQEFKILDPMTKGIISAHAAQHKQHYQAEQLQQMQMMQAMQGTPSTPGRASQPAAGGGAATSAPGF